MSWYCNVKMLVKEKGSGAWKLGLDFNTATFNGLVGAGGPLYGVEEVIPSDEVNALVCGENGDPGWKFYSSTALVCKKDELWKRLEESIGLKSRIEAYVNSEAFWKLADKEKEHVRDELSEAADSVEDWRGLNETINGVLGLFAPYDMDEDVLLAVSPGV